MCENVISRYAKRLQKCEKMCLADFAAWYDIKRRQNTRSKSCANQLLETDMEENKDDDPEIDIETIEDSPSLILSDGTQMHKRKQKKILRYVRYNVKQDSENHFREQLMPFYPWRNENEIMGGFQTFEEKYESDKEIIFQKRLEYETLVEDISEAEQQVNNELDEEVFDTVAPTTQHAEQQLQTNVEEDIDENLFTSYDIGQDLGHKEPMMTQSEEVIQNRLAEEEFLAEVLSLNKKQTEIFYHVLKFLRTSSTQLFLFVTGGAGVGKTKLTKTLYQALIRHYNRNPGKHPELTQVLLTAPTGKAAFLIKGTTIHSAF